MPRTRKEETVSEFIDNQCRLAGYSTLSAWARAIDVPKTSLYNLATRPSHVQSLLLHMKLAESRRVTLDVWAKRYLRAMREAA